MTPRAGHIEGNELGYVRPLVGRHHWDWDLPSLAGILGLNWFVEISSRDQFAKIIPTGGAFAS